MAPGAPAVDNAGREGIVTRDSQEIQRAHDLFEALYLELQERKSDCLALTNVGSVVDVLAWLLGHGGERFQRQLAMVERMLAAADKGLEQSEPVTETIQ